MRRNERVTDEMVLAHAKEDAIFAGTEFSALGRADRARYLERSRRCLSAALSEQTQPATADQPDYWTTHNNFENLSSRQGFALEKGEVVWDFATQAWANADFPVSRSSLVDNSHASEEVVERWQPIETAPKDGTKIIATGKYGVRVVWWGAGAFNRKINAYDRDWTDCVTYGFKLTHWRPLPAPPTTTRIADSAEAGGSATLSKDHANG